MKNKDLNTTMQSLSATHLTRPKKYTKNAMEINFKMLA